MVKAQHFQRVLDVPAGLDHATDLNNSVHLRGPPCPDHIGLPEGVEGRFRKVDGSAGLSACKRPDILDAGELQHFLADITGDKPDTLRRGLESNPDTASGPLHLHGDRVRDIAAAFPAATATAYLDEVHLRLDNRFLDRVADLHVLALAKADVPVAVAYDDNRTELDTAARVGHALHHGDIEDLILEIREERINNLGFLDRPAAC